MKEQELGCKMLLFDVIPKFINKQKPVCLTCLAARSASRPVRRTHVSCVHPSQRTHATCVQSSCGLAPLHLCPLRCPQARCPRACCPRAYPCSAMVHWRRACAKVYREFGRVSRIIFYFNSTTLRAKPDATMPSVAFKITEIRPNKVFREFGRTRFPANS